MGQSRGKVQNLSKVWGENYVACLSHKHVGQRTCSLGAFVLHASPEHAVCYMSFTMSLTSPLDSLKCPFQWLQIKLPPVFLSSLINVIRKISILPRLQCYRGINSLSPFQMLGDSSINRIIHCPCDSTRIIWGVLLPTAVQPSGVLNLSIRFEAFVKKVQFATSQS